MNTSFSIARFGNLFKKHTAEHYKGYLMALVVTAGIIAFVLGYISFIDRERMDPLPVNQQWTVFTFVLLVSGAVFTSNIFADAGNKKRAIALLTLPATQYEKFLVKWVYSYLIFQTLIIILFYVILGAMLQINHNPEKHSRMLNIFHQKEIAEVFLAYAAIHAMAIWGALFFNRLHFIKTGVLFVIGFMVLLMANSQFMQALLGIKQINALPFSDVRFNIGDKYYEVSTSQDSNTQFLSTLLLLAFVFWTAAYYRLKEKQI